MLKTFVSAKLHGIHVTAKSLDYNGSASIDYRLMEAAGITAHEQIHVVNANNGQRWVTYAIPVEQKGAFTLNGAAARLGEEGDRCIVICYAMAEQDPEAKVVFLDKSNAITRTTRYSAAHAIKPAPELV
jgi:aspartate 1-decarboxylase